MKILRYFFYIIKMENCIVKNWPLLKLQQMLPHFILCLIGECFLWMKMKGAFC